MECEVGEGIKMKSIGECEHGVINATEGMLAAFEDGKFHMERCEAYIDASVPGIKEICINDM